MAFGPNPPPLQPHLGVRGARYGRVRDPFGHVWAFNALLAQS